MRASPTGFGIALLATVVAAGMASAQSSYPCTETNSNLPNPYRQVANWASPPRPWSPVNAVAVDRNNNLWAVDRCETDDCVPVIELGPDGRTLANFGRGLFVEGLFARLMYRSLRIMHERTVNGALRTALGLLARGLSRRTGPQVKLH